MIRNTGKRIDLDLTSHEDYLTDAKQIINGIPFDEVSETDEVEDIVIPEEPELPLEELDTEDDGNGTIPEDGDAETI